MKDSGTSPAKASSLFKALEQIVKGSGKIVVKGDGKDAEIVVINGLVTEVKSEMTESSALVNLLVNTGLVSDETIRKVRNSKETQGMPLLEALVATGSVSQSVVTEALEFLCHEALVELLLQEDVVVTIEEVQTTAKKEMCAIPVRFVLRDAQKRVEELPQVTKVIPYESMVFVKALTLTGRLSTKQWAEMPLEPQDRQVFVLVNGRRSVKEISRLTGLTMFRVSKALKNLLDLGLIRQVEKPLPATQGKPNRIRYFSALALVIVVLSILTQPIVRHFVPAHNEVVVTQEQVFSSVHRETTVLCADAFRLLNGNDPKSLNDLRNIGILKRCKTLGE
jgi:hypothetical protein